MTRFKTLKSFEQRFEHMPLDEMREWEKYWTQHAQCLAPKVKKEAMKRVHLIRQIILKKEQE